MSNHAHGHSKHDCCCQGTLCQAEVGTLLKIKKVNDDGPTGQRLREMGFCESAEIKKLSDSSMLLCSVCGAKFALSRELAERIHVDPIDEKKKR